MGQAELKNLFRKDNMMKEVIFGRRKLALATWICVALLLPVVDTMAQTLTPQLGDLILGFRASGSPGQTLNLEVDLGNMSNFYDAAAGATIPLPGLSVQDLINTYGASWSTRTDLVWGAVASTGRASGTPDGHAVVDTLWATDPAGESAWIRGSKFAQATASENVEELTDTGSGGTLYGASSTSNSSEAAVINATLSGSWSAEDLKTAGESFGYFNPTIDSPATAVTSGQVVSALYELQPTNVSGVAGTLLGNLILTPSGLSFRAASGIAAPVAAFSGSPTNGVAPLTVNFTDASTGSITGWSWVFGDGNTSTNEDPSDTYSNAGSYSVTLTVSGPGGSNSFTQTNYIVVETSGQPPTITTTNPLPDGMVGNPYVGTFTATGGTPPYTWSVVSNSLPDGLALVAGTGAITGTPTVATTASFTVQVEDTNTLFSDETFSLTIDPASTRIISLGGNLAFGAVITGATANATLTITNSGNAALTVSSITYPTGFRGAFSGAVPSGGSVNVTVTFAPTAVTSYGGTITVNANQTAGTTTIVASGTGVPPASSVIGLSGDLAFGNVITGATATASLLVFNTGNTNLTIASISYPSGFSGAFSGVIAPGGATNVTVTFAPTGVTNYSGIVTVTSDATGGTNTLVASGTGVVAPTPPTIVTSGLLPTGTVDLAYSQALAATGGATPYQWSVASGRLPAGLTLSVGGVIGGTPLVATNSSFTVRVMGADGLSSTSSFSLVVLGVTGFVPGRYDGLATFTNSIAGEVIGSVRVVVTKTGAFHAQIKVNGTRYIGRGQFDSSGNWTGTLGALSGTLRVDVAKTTDQITGALASSGFTGSVLANRAFFSTANPPPWVGSYTTLLAGPDDASIPSGLGWANVQVSSTGWVALKGQLADGSRFTETVPISKYGTWPLYDTPNGVYSLLGGWVTMTNVSVAFETGSMLSDVNADLLWYRPALPTSHVFPAGFTTELTLVGSSYTIPAPGTTILPVTDNTCNTFVVFGGGSLTAPVTNTVTLTMTDRIINCSGGVLSLSVNPSRGAFTGSYVLPGTTKPVGISGLFLQNGSVGGGSFFEGNTTGYITIEPLIEPTP